MNKVLITGGAGFIGFHLAKYLAEEKNEVTICDNLFRGKMDSELKELLERENVNYIECDLTDSKELDKLDKDYDEVYHLAAINGTKNFYEIPDVVLRVNTLATINILDWFIQTKGKKIVFSSSSEAYAGTMRKFGIKIPTPEDVALCVEDVNNARWSYGGSKIVGELFFINYARKHNFDMSIIRYHNIYGGRMGYDHVMPEFCIRIINKEDPFIIYGGKETRAFCHINDAVKATELVMKSDKVNNEIIHVGNDADEISIKELAEKMFKITGFEPSLDIHPAPKGCVQRRCPDISKLKTLTGYEPKVLLDDGLKDIFSWYEKNPKKN